MNSVRQYFLHLFLVVILLSSLLRVQQAQAQSIATLGLTVNRDRRTMVYFSLPTKPKDGNALQQNLMRAVGMELQKQRLVTGTGSEGDGTEAYRRWAFVGNGVLPASGMLTEGLIDPAPLYGTLRQMGVKSLRIRLTLPGQKNLNVVGATKMEMPTLPGALGRQLRNSAHYSATVSMNSPSQPIRFSYGYQTEDVLKICVPLLIVLTLPIFLTLWSRNRALSAENADPTAIWFGYWRFQSMVATGGWIGWIATTIALGTSSFLQEAFHLEAGTERAVSLFFVLVPPALVQAFCAALSQPVQERIRGIQQAKSELAKETFWTLALRIIPFNCSLTALFKFTAGDTQQAILWFGAGWFIRQFCTTQLVKVSGAKPFALTTGELHDRVFTLAKQAKVKLQYLFIQPAEKSQMANAFAARGNIVILTDYLLQRLTRREVDAIMAHELTHLRCGHNLSLQVLFYISLGVPIVLWMLLRYFGGAALEGWAFLSPVVTLVGMPFYHYMSREFERQADAGAVALTGDPEAMITGLVRVSKLNLMPIEWGKSNESFSTHPSTLRRAQEIAQRNGISPERLDTLLRTPLEQSHYTVNTGLTPPKQETALQTNAPIVPPLPPGYVAPQTSNMPSVSSVPLPSESSYQLPEEAKESDRVFSSAFRARMSMKRLLAFIAAMILPLLVAGHLVQAQGLEGAALWLLYTGGMVVSFALYLAVTWFSQIWGVAEVQQKLRDKLLSSDPNPAEYTCVGFAPEALPVTYGGYRDWDMGFLRLSEHQIIYIGEQVRFALTREMIVSVSLVEAKVNWWSLPRIAVAWKDEAQGRSGVFTWRPPMARRVGDLRAATEAIQKRLETWRTQPEPTGTVFLEPIESPRIGKVNGQSPHVLGTFSTLFKTLKVIGVFAIVTALLTGLSFSLARGGAALYVLVGTVFVTILSWLPQYSYRDPEVPPVPQVTPPPVVPPLPPFAEDREPQDSSV